MWQQGLPALPGMAPGLLNRHGKFPFPLSPLGSGGPSGPAREQLGPSQPR